MSYPGKRVALFAGSFLVRRVLETDCVAILEEESSGS